jgi:NAD+ diphosphatase
MAMQDDTRPRAGESIEARLAFELGATPPASLEDAMHVIVRRAEPFSSSRLLRGREILVAKNGSCLFPASALGAEPASKIYLGRVEGRPCFASVHDEPLGGGEFASLRAVLLTMGPKQLDVLSTAVQLATWDEQHRFCSRCAAPLVVRDGERVKQCAACELDYYPRIAPCVIVLVHDGERLLLTHKPKMPFYALVAGFVEAGESLEDAVKREVKEETGATVGELEYFASQKWPFPHHIMVGFLARYRSGEIAIDERELDEVAWFHRDELPPIPPPLSIARSMIDAFLARPTGAR